ncbi:hypothetical protein I4U23_003728 [Adineta vaga]|nr:hypothetical protein I4U23_003728 [Adineta vaga]
MANNKLKIVLIGDTNVGKSSLLSRFMNKTFTETSSPTIGADFLSHTIKQDRKRTRLYFYDTSGQEKFHQLISSFLQNATGVIIVFDVTNTESFENVEQWTREVNSYLSTNTNKILVGNKCDLTAKRVIDYAQAKTLAESFNMPYVETSAKDSTNIEEAFSMILDHLIQSLPDATNSNLDSSIQSMTSEEKIDLQDSFRILLFGDSGVGKSCLLERLTKNIFHVHSLPTIGFNVESHKINHNGITTKMDIWDITGNEQLRSLASNIFDIVSHFLLHFIPENYCAETKGIIVVFDVTNKKSFESVTGWLQEGDKHIKRLLVGNKCDLTTQRIIDYDQAKNLADSFNIPYVEISVKNNTNLEQAFIKLIS